MSAASTGKLRYSTLERVPVDRLYAAFLDAFSDYAVPIQLSLDGLRTMHARRGIDYAVSVGAFDGERLVGFIFNGDGTWKGGRCAYDGGTGVLPSHRGLGLSGALAAESERVLRAAGFERWLLEVLVGNDKAISTYRKAGFEPTRRFSCPDGLVPDAAALAADAARKAGVAIVPLDPREVASLAAFRDWEPSWQNSDDSLRRTPEALVSLAARSANDPAGAPLGYAVATDSGSVFQLAVKPDARRRGIGRALTAAIASRVPDGRLRYVNVQADDAETLGLLASLGAVSDIDQWEMIKEFRA